MITGYFCYEVERKCRFHLETAFLEGQIVRSELLDLKTTKGYHGICCILFVFVFLHIWTNKSLILKYFFTLFGISK